MCVRRTLMCFDTYLSVCFYCLRRSNRENERRDVLTSQQSNSIKLGKTQWGKQHATDDVTLLRHFMDRFSGSVQSEKIVHFICQLNWKTSRCGS